MIDIVAVATTVVALLVKVIGLPDQVRKNHRAKSTAGLSIPFFALAWLSYGLWAVYGAMRGDLVLTIGQGAGVVTVGIILGQAVIYRDRGDTATPPPTTSTGHPATPLASSAEYSESSTPAETPTTTPHASPQPDPAETTDNQTQSDLYSTHAPQDKII